MWHKRNSQRQAPAKHAAKERMITARLRVHRDVQLLESRGSKYPIFQVLGPNTIEGMVLESETSNIGYLDPRGRPGDGSFATPRALG